MEPTIDRLVTELNAMNTAGQFATVDDGSPLDLKDVKWDDPGIVLVREYPYFYVAPINDQLKSSTAGLAGFDVRVLTIDVCLVINQSDYFDPTVSEVPGSRVLVRSMTKVSKWLRRLSKSKLDGTVRSLAVGGISYVPDMRGDAFVRMAVMRLVVEKQYQHEE